MTLRIAVLGLGEAGSLIARDLVAAGADVRGYDPAGISVDGVQARGSEADAVADVDVVLSVNSSHDAMTALENALPSLSAGTLWADLNTASPGLKEALADRAAERDVPVVDVALMSPVPGKGLRTPMLVSGEAAGCADWLRGNIAAELAGFDERTVERLVDGTHAHARRRADEMAAATEQLEELGVPARTAAAARDLLVELRDAPIQRETT